MICMKKVSTFFFVYISFFRLICIGSVVVVIIYKQKPKKWKTNFKQNYRKTEIWLNLLTLYERGNNKKKLVSCNHIEIIFGYLFRKRSIIIFIFRWCNIKWCKEAILRLLFEIEKINRKPEQENINSAKLLFQFPFQFDFFFTAKCACHHHGCRIGVCYPANYHRQTVIWSSGQNNWITRSLVFRFTVYRFERWPDMD